MKLSNTFELNCIAHVNNPKVKDTILQYVEHMQIPRDSHNHKQIQSSLQVTFFPL